MSTGLAGSSPIPLLGKCFSQRKVLEPLFPRLLQPFSSDFCVRCSFGCSFEYDALCSSVRSPGVIGCHEAKLLVIPFPAFPSSLGDPLARAGYAPMQRPE